MLQNNADLKATSELLGHSRPDTTMRVYQHVHPEVHRDAISHLVDISPDSAGKEAEKCG
jgi:integrase